MNVEATRARERVGIQTALCGPLLTFANLFVVHAPWGGTAFSAGVCFFVGLGLFFGAEVHEEETPTSVMAEASKQIQALMAELSSLRQRHDVLRDENETLTRRLDTREDRSEGLVIRQAFGLPTAVLGCRTCNEKGCAACDRHAWVAREEEQGWPSL